MNAKVLFNLCTDVNCECMGCPYKDDEQACAVVIDAIHRLRHPKWYVKDKNPVVNFRTQLQPKEY